MNILSKNVLIIAKKLAIAILIVLVTVLLVVPFSCRTSLDSYDSLSGDFSSPHLKSFSVESSNKISLTFDKEIKVSEASFCEESDAENEIEVSSEYNENNSSVNFIFPRETDVGKRYVLNSIIEDKHGNSLTLSVPFVGYNANIPRLALSEVRSSYGDVSDGGIKTKRGEFVEIVALDDGNLSGVELLSAGDGEDKKYEFPPIFVKRGEYITVHLRKIQTSDYDGIVDEDSDLKASKSVDSNSFALDLWVDNTTARIAKDDIVLLRRCRDGAILDCVLFVSPDKEAWPKSYEPYIRTLETKGNWYDTEGNISVSIESACSNAGMEYATRSLSRQNIALLIEKAAKDDLFEVKEDALQWFVVVKNRSADPGPTPGYKNSANKYIPKK